MRDRSRSGFSTIRILLGLAALVLTGGSGVDAGAETLRARVAFDPDDLRIQEVDGRTRVAMRGVPSGSSPDVPSLPVAVKTFVIPSGLEVRDVRVVRREERTLASGVTLERRAVAFDDGGEASGLAFPDAALDPSASSHPARSAVSLGGGFAAGHHVHSVALFPLRLEHAGNDLVLTTGLEIELDLEPARRTTELRRLRVNEAAERAFGEAIAALVENPGDLPRLPASSAAGDAVGRAPVTGLDGDPAAPARGFAPRDVPSVEGSAVDMVILTTAALEPGFQALAEWKTRKGVPTVIRTVEWVEANYPAGHDQPEKVRLFLRDAYSKWGTFLLLVGGDFEELKPRLAMNRFFFGGELIPTDQYWACLDGDWNGDGDGDYGEGAFGIDPGDAADLYPDLFVGRAAVASLAEVATFVSKSMTYDRSPPVGYVEDVCHFTEVLFPAEWEFGDPPEDIVLDGEDFTAELDDDIDAAWTRLLCSQSANTQSRNHALARLNEGHHLLTLMNHGDAFKFSVGNGLNPLIFTADTDALTNGDRLMVVVATACNPNQFDLESCGESLMNNPNGGAVAVIGPTRVDFPASATIFHEEMLRIIFSQGVTRFGAATQVNRIPFLPFAYSEQTANRWTVLTKLLLGDPELRMWTEEPGTLLVSHAAAVPLGSGSIAVTVTDSGSSPVPDALVCVSDATGTYARARTDLTGMATLVLASAAPGTVDVVVTKAEFLPHEGTFAVDPIAAAMISLSGTTLDDDATGSSLGNGDGVVDAGETIELVASVVNGGGATADSVTVTASIEPGSSATFDFVIGGLSDPAEVFVGPDRVSPGTLPFTLDFAAPSIEYSGSPSLVWAPDTTSDEGVFLWQDRKGWHIWWASGEDTVTVTGTVTTDGRVRGIGVLELEAGVDTAGIAVSGDTLTFQGITGPADGFDRLDFALADDTALSVTGGAVSLGSIGPAATQDGTVVLDVAANVRAEHLAYVDLVFMSPSGGPWAAEVPLVVAAPSLEAYRFAVDDSESPPATIGNGNGAIEVGEKVRLTPTVLNRGNGSAESVTGSASAASGITFEDASDGYGSLAPLGRVSGTDGYVFTVDDSTGTSIDLVLSDSVGRTWAKTIEFVVPEAPSNLAFTSSSGEITLRWDSPEPASNRDVAGYNVYRSPTSSSGFVVQNFELLRAGTRYVDEDLPVGSGFFYEVTAVDSSGNEGMPSTELFAWTTQPQVGGWPKNAGGNVFGSVAMEDADGDGRSEIYLGSSDFGLYAWDDAGSERQGFPVEANGQIWSTPGLADLDEDGDLEILWGANDSRFYAVHHDSTPVFGSDPHMIDLVGTGSLMRSAATIADVNQDQDLEFFFGTDSGRLYAFRHDGTAFGADPSGLLRQLTPAGSQSRIWGSIAIADLAGDGNRKIVFASRNDSLYVLNPDGSSVPGFPRGATDDYHTGPSIGDLDNDGTMEILVGNNDGNLYVYNHDGTDYLPGGIFASLPDDIRAVPALCNLDADPELEVFVTCHDGRLYCFQHDGTGFLNPGGIFVEIDTNDRIFASPIVADVDGDLDYEVFVGHLNGKFYGYHHDGSLMLGMPIPTNQGIYSTAAAGDLDGDGDVDVAFASYDQTVNVIDFGGALHATALEWPTYAANNFRTSVYGEAGPYQTGSPDIGPVIEFALAQNAPNPFGGATTIRWAVGRSAPVRLRVFDVSGRLVRTLLEGTVDPGPHTAVWDGRDEAGRRVSSGVYFYRLEDGIESRTRKSVMLR